MCFPRELVYFGNDRLHYAFLQSQLKNIAIVWQPELPAGFALENWNRIYVIDQGNRGLELLLQLKLANAGAPAIMLFERGDFPLAQILGAFVDGAEAIFQKPLHRPEMLIECIHDCAKRLDQWAVLLSQCARGPSSANAAQRQLTEKQATRQPENRLARA